MTEGTSEADIDLEEGELVSSDEEDMSKQVCL